MEILTAGVGYVRFRKRMPEATHEVAPSGPDNDPQSATGES